MRIVLADDNAIFRERLSLILQDKLPDSVIVQVAGWKELKQYTQCVETDFLLVDLDMLGNERWKAALKDLVENNHCVISALSGSNELRQIETAFAIGASGYICKNSKSSELTQAVQQLFRSKSYIPPEIYCSHTSVLRCKESLRQSRWNTAVELVS